jgi:hypothetical protein
MKKILLFVLEFLALSVPLTWLWVSWVRPVYASFFHYAATAIYALFGLSGVPTPMRQRYIHYIPFVVLMILTPRLSARRRFGGIALGALALFLFQVAANWIASPAGTLRLVLPIPIGLLSDALPFVLWALIAHEFVRDAAHRALGTRPSVPDRS